MSFISTNDYCMKYILFISVSWKIVYLISNYIYNINLFLFLELISLRSSKLIDINWEPSYKSFRLNLFYGVIYELDKSILRYCNTSLLLKTCKARKCIDCSLGE